MDTIKHPAVRVRLVGTDGNAFAIIGAVSKALRKEVGREAADAFTQEAFASSSYDALLQLCMRTVNVE